MPEEDKHGKSTILGLLIAMVGIGLPMIGIVQNLPLGILCLTVAFILLARIFWVWEVAHRFSVPARVSMLWVLGLLYFSLVGFQTFRQYRKDHPIVAATGAPGTPVATPTHSDTQQPKKQTQQDENPKTPRKDHPAASARSVPSPTAPALQAPANTVPPQQTVNAPNGIGAIGGTLINPQVNNYAPPRRELTDAQVSQFAQNLGDFSSARMLIIPAATSDDVGPLISQICAAVAKAGSSCNPQHMSSFDGSGPSVQGLECHAPDWDRGNPALFKNAMTAAGLICQYIKGPFTWNDVTVGVGGIVVVVGTPTR